MDKVTITRAERCTTHHFGCDCWQYKFQNMEMSLASLQRKCDDLKAENEKMKSELDTLRKHRAYASEFLDATEKLEIAREALGWYANEENWTEKVDDGDLDGMNVRHEDPPMWSDNGKRARDGLERIK